MPENSHPDRIDSFEEKLRLLQDAWKRGDHDVARSLTHSLRDSAIQAQIDQPANEPHFPASPIRETRSLPTPWIEWTKAWKWFHAFQLHDPLRLPRQAEPIELTLGFPKDQISDPARELRVVLIENNSLREIPSQLLRVKRRNNELVASLLFLAPPSPTHELTILVLHGNPNAELPTYTTDLSTRGEGFALEIENAFFKASLSHQMGQLERLSLKHGFGLELVAGGEGHGEPPCIDWAHDYAASGHFQKFRITLWDTCPDFEIVRGPVATLVRRWGFPHAPLHPLHSAARLHVDVEYRFYANLPWFHKLGTMKALKSFEASALRDDEWVFTGQPFTNIVWMGPNGELQHGPPPPNARDNLWAVGFVNPQTHDSFIALFLQHHAENLPELKHNASPNLYYKAHGQVWSRYPLPTKDVPAGAVLHQKNAYAALEFNPSTGPASIQNLRNSLAHPLHINATELPPQPNAIAPTSRLARPGESDDSPIPKHLIWNALRECKDEQLYTAKPNIVDLGLIRDIRVHADTVHVVMSMPHRGRPRWGYFAHGSGGNSVPIRTRLLQIPGVHNVVVEHVWTPAWDSNRITEEGRAALGLPS